MDKTKEILDIVHIKRSEQSIFYWWLKIRWFMVFVLFAIGILRVNQQEQAYPIIIFIAVFLGICILNFLFHLLIIKPNRSVIAIQIVLDTLFATIIVHLTGGFESNFVWIYLIGILTACLSTEKTGGFLAAMIGSMFLLFLMIFYNSGWLLTINGKIFEVDIPTQTIFFISYITLFSGVSFILTHITDLLKMTLIKYNEISDKCEETKTQLNEYKKNNLQYQKIAKQAAIVAGLDHAINNSLNAISLSSARINKAAREYEDDKLHKTTEILADSISKITQNLEKIKKLKKFDIIKEIRDKE
ncbi:MAG: histidine kinase [Armatimonadetes bacterium]|nr:histidine kinase [Armatimonadota bacterium]